MTLREALTVRINLFDRSGFAAAAHHALVHGQQDFTAYLQWGSQQQIMRAPDTAFGRVFNRHHAITALPRLYAAKHLVNRSTRLQQRLAAELAPRGFFTEGALRTEIRHGNAVFEGAAGRHDFQIQVGNRTLRQRAPISRG